MNLSYKPLIRWIANFVELQLFLTLCSLPFLLGWGLPLSLVTLLGNIIFTPFLAGFLFLSSLIFILEVCHCPNQLLVICLEKMALVWQYLLGMGSDRWLWYSCKPSWPVLIAIPLCSLAVLQYKKKLVQWKRIALFVMILFLVHMFCFFIRPDEKMFTVACGTKHLTIIHNNNSTIAIDLEGAFGQVTAYNNWIQFQLAPQLIKQLGSPIIDHLVLSKVGLRVFEITRMLIERNMVNSIHLPFWKATLSKKAWNAYFQLKKIAQSSECAIIRYDSSKKQVLFFEYPDNCLCFQSNQNPARSSNCPITLQAWYTIDKKETRLL